MHSIQSNAGVPKSTRGVSFVEEHLNEFTADDDNEAALGRRSMRPNANELKVNPDVRQLSTTTEIIDRENTRTSEKIYSALTDKGEVENVETSTTLNAAALIDVSGSILCKVDNGFIR